jgi:hypothetical protein
MNAQHRFPFGQELKQVKQTDTTPKKVFVLGVYASAVHAKWSDANGKELVKALAVAGEPCIFWTGDTAEAKNIVSNIKVPDGFGSLVAVDTLNGPSGRCLDEDILRPLNLTRKDVWLCDLVPHSCQNPSQKEALARAYDGYMEQGKLPVYDMPEVPKNIAEERVQEILQELKQSKADTIILLGDQPIQQFLAKFSGRYKKLSDFAEYGQPVDVTIDNKAYTVIALAHPRQIGKLGIASQKWYDMHQQWVKEIQK